MVLGTLYLNLLNGQTGTVTTAAIDARGFSNITVYMIGAGTVSGGAVKISEAHAADYAGTWSDVDVTLTPTAVTGGAVQANSLPVGAYGFLRAQVTSAITGGGSLSLVLVGT